MLVALTVFVATLIGRIANGHMWVGALVTGVIELALGFWLLKRGLVDVRRAVVHARGDARRARRHRALGRGAEARLTGGAGNGRHRARVRPRAP